jgi:hypothetical protein
MTAAEKHKLLLATYMAMHPMTESDVDEYDYPTEEAARRAAVWVFQQMTDADFGEESQLPNTERR